MNKRLTWNDEPLNPLTFAVNFVCNKIAPSDNQLTKEIYAVLDEYIKNGGTGIKDFLELLITPELKSIFVDMADLELRKILLETNIMIRELKGDGQPPDEWSMELVGRKMRIDNELRQIWENK